MNRCLQSAIYFNYGLDVPVAERFQLIAVGDNLFTENDDSGDLPQLTEYAGELSEVAMEKAAVELGAKPITDVLKEQMERCETGFCPDLKEKLEHGSHCVLMNEASKAAKNDSVVGISRGSLVFVSDPETPYLIQMGVVSPEEV